MDVKGNGVGVHSAFLHHYPGKYVACLSASGDHLSSLWTAFSLSSLQPEDGVGKSVRDNFLKMVKGQ